MDKEIIIEDTFATKNVLTFSEVAKYTGFSKSYLYKLTSGRKIPHYCPTGKVLFFNRIEIEKWLLGNRISTSDELQSEAMSYCTKKGRN